MTRPVTLFTGQFADIPLADLAAKAAEWEYDGLELACWGKHLDVERAAKEKKYVKEIKDILSKHSLKVYAISNHLAGQLVSDPNTDSRSDAIAPSSCKGNPEKKRKWAIATMKDTARAAKNLGVKIVNGFTGSPIWHMVYGFPPVSEDLIEKGYKEFAKQWNPILDVFDKCRVKFALEVHPTEIAFDIITARRALKAVKNRKAFGFNLDPSHLYWQSVDSARFAREFGNKIYHVHMKDAALTLDGESSILSSYLGFGEQGRGWDFRSVGRGGVDFEEMVRALNEIGYNGPLSVEWEDCAMDRQFGAAEACQIVKDLNYPKAGAKFEKAFTA